MTRVVILVLAACAMALATPCAPDSAFDYTTGIQAQPCDVGTGANQMSLFNVIWTSKSKANDKSVDPKNVLLTPLVDATGHFLGLGFSAEPGNPGLFEVDSSHMIEATLQWFIDPRTPILDGFSVSIDPPFGFAQITATAFYGVKTEDFVPPTHLDSSTVTVFVHPDGTTVPDASFKFLAPANWVEVFMDITIGDQQHPSGIDGGGGTVSITGAVPEPATFGIAGLALTGLLALRRRAAKT